jgi:hypothetical protein
LEVRISWEYMGDITNHMGIYCNEYYSGIETTMGYKRILMEY